MLTIIVTEKCLALQQLQEGHPKDWEKELATAVDQLRKLKRVYNYDNFPDTLQRVVNSNGKPANYTALRAACWMLNEKERIGIEIIKTESRALRIEEQLHALREKDWPPVQKEIISDFYHGQIAKLDDRLRELLYELPIIGAQEIH